VEGFEGSNHLDAAIEQLRRCNFYGVLKALRQVLPIEAFLLGRAAPAVASGSSVRTN
jgi:hypothetical protein